CLRGLGAAVEPGLRRIEPAPTRQFGCETNFTPFRVTWRLRELRDLREKCLNEPLNPSVPIAVGLRPIVSDEHRINGNRIDRLTGRDYVGVVVMCELGRQIICNELRRVWNWNEVQAICRVQLGHRPYRFARDQNGSG